ncbi:hypothetical protein ACF06Q_29790 [Streptomyces leeuwenhoekii]|uniref:hypothetical protein n=1 Tax=Streptomyces leeuwenhoekii TaxID=1437453 RepID=UPI0037033E98
MIVIGWAITVAALAVAWVLQRLVRYPGGWRYAFHEEHRAARGALRDARSAVRQLDRAARRERWQALAGVQRAEWAYRRRIRQVEAELWRLRTPHRGERIGQLGDITLYEHALVVREDEVPLADLQVRFELARSAHWSYVYLTQPDGRERMERYEDQAHPEDAVRRFTVQIQNAVAATDRLQQQRAEEISACEAELRAARKATAPVEAAQEKLAEIRARHDADLELPHARAALEDARSAWADLTGRRPL